MGLDALSKQLLLMAWFQWQWWFQISVQYILKFLEDDQFLNPSRASFLV